MNERLFRPAVIGLLSAICASLVWCGSTLVDIRRQMPSENLDVTKNISRLQEDVATLVLAAGKDTAQTKENARAGEWFAEWFAGKQDLEAVAKRSSTIRAAFQRETPCPANGATIGPCPGYVIDHVIPLCAGGPDTADNMQWQTVAAAKIKDQDERRQCAALKSRAPK